MSRDFGTRQQVYKSSGLECVWLLRVNSREKSFSYFSDFKTRTREIPIFPFTKEHNGFFYVHETQLASDLNKGRGADYSLEMVDFIEELFSGRVQFTPQYSLNNNHKICLTMRFIKCKQCRNQLRVPLIVWHYMKRYEYWDTTSVLVENLEPDMVSIVNELFSQQYGFIPLHLYEHRLYGLGVYTQCPCCGKYIPLLYRFFERGAKDGNTSLKYVDLPWPEPFDYPKNEKEGNWFYSGNKPVIKTWDMRHADDERRAESRRLKKEQSKLQTSEASNDQPN